MRFQTAKPDGPQLRESAQCNPELGMVCSIFAILAQAKFAKQRLIVAIVVNNSRGVNLADQARQ